MSFRLSILALLLSALFACSGGNDRSSQLPVPVTDNPAPGGDTGNRAPITANDILSITGGTVSVGVLDNDSDPDGDSLSILFVGRPSHGEVLIDDNDTPSFTSDDRVIYTTDDGYVGTDIFSYTVSDGRDGRANGYVTLVVGAGGVPGSSANQKPVAKSDTATTEAPASVVIDVLANDTDGDDQLLALFSFSAASNGAVSLDDNGTPDSSDDRLLYTPDPGFTGSDSLIYSVTDGIDVATGAVNIFVASQDALSADSEEVCGVVMLGPVNAATVTLYRIDGYGEATGAPIAQSRTDAKGRWCVVLPTDRQALLIESRGGIFPDPSDSRYEVGAARILSIASQYALESMLPSDASFAALTVFSNAVLRKSRQELEGANFATVFAGNRAQAAEAFGFDVVTTEPADPVLPAADATDDARRYAMVVGAAATSLNQIAVDLDVAAPNYILIDALIRDLSECRLDGRDANGPVNVMVGGAIRSISDNIDLNLQILRFRNNLTAAYRNVPLVQIDQPVCAAAVVRPDETAPRFRSLPNNLRVIAVAGNTVALSDQIIQQFIDSAVASDDRDGIVPVSVRLPDGSDLPDTLGFGATAVQFGAVDSAGNEAESVLRIIEVGQSGPPQTFPDLATTSEDVAVEIDVLANDLGQENPIDSGSVLVSRLPQFGSLSVDAGTGRVTYVPYADRNGTDDFSYTVADVGGKRSSPVEVLIDVVAQNDAPRTLVDVVSTRNSESLVIDVLANDTDVESGLDYGSLQITTAPANGIAAVDFVTGKVVYSPSPNYVGPDSLSYIVADESGLFSNNTVVTIDVLAPEVSPNVRPLAASDLVITDEDVPIVIDVLGNDVDTDGTVNPASVTIIERPVFGTLAVDPDSGDVTYTPAGDYFGSDQFTYRVTDDQGLTSNTASVFVNVAPVNDAPVALDDITQGVEDAVSRIALLANDQDVDGLAGALVVLVSQPLNGTALWDDASAELVYTPNPGFDGSDSLTYQIQDADGLLSDPALVTINLTGQNDAPVAAADSFTVLNNTSSALDVLSNDIDIDSPLQNSGVTIVSAPAQVLVSYDAVADALVYTADVSFSGNDSFSYQVTDPDGALSNTVVVTLDVQQTQFAPQANDDAVAAQEQISVSIPVLANDTDVNNDLDAASVLLVSAPLNGSASVSPTGDIVYTSNDNYSGPDLLEYSVADALGARSSAATVMITVSDVSEPPLATDDVVTTPEDTSIDISVLVNDSDPESDIDPSTLVLITTAQRGTISVDPVTALVTYSPDADYNGPDGFSYTVADEAGLVSNVATVTIDVLDVNDQPVAGADAAGTNEDTSVDINVLANDSDVDGTLDAASVVIEAQPVSGVVSVDGATGMASYTPDADFFGTDSFTYRVWDNDGAGSGAALVTITVAPVNDAPVASNDAVTTDENVAVTVDVAQNDYDADGASDLASVQVVSSPSSGVVTAGTLPTEFVYTPDFNSNGGDQFSYQILDSSGSVSNTATVDITVAPLPSPPVTVDRTATVDNDTFRNIRVLRNATDPEDDIVNSSVMVVTDASNGTTEVRNNGRVRYTPNPGYVGIDVFTFNVSDATGLTSNTSTVTVTVNATSSINPVATDVTSILVFRGDTPTIDLTSAVTDSDGTVDFSTLVVSNESVGSANVLGATGSVEFNLPVDFVGEATFEYSVEDNDGLESNTAEVLVTVWPSEDRDLDGVAEAIELETGTDPAAADSIYVYIDPNTPSASPDGSSWNEAYPTLASAAVEGKIVEAPGNVVYVLMATNTDVTAVGQDWTVALSGNCDNLIFIGSLDPFVATPRAYNSGSPRTKLKAVVAGERPVDIRNCNNIQFRHVQITGGSDVSRGGGIQLYGSDALLDNVHVHNNTAINEGGGVFVDNGGGGTTLSVVSSSVYDNTLQPGVDSDSSGGGIYVKDGDGLSIVDSIIRHNRAPVNGSVQTDERSGGGGLYVENTSLYVSNSAVSANSTGQCGGGIRVDGNDSMRIEHSVISGNEALGLGGGVCFDSTNANLVMHNNVLASNYADTGGGFYATDMDRSVVSNNTIVYNLASTSGGGAYLDTGANPVVNYNIVQYNASSGLSADVGGDPSQLLGIDANYNFVSSFFANFVGVGNSSFPIPFDNGYYQDQGSPGVNYGVIDSDDPLYALNLRYTDQSGTVTDTGLLDAGFHYSEPQSGSTNGLQIVAPDGLYTGRDNQRIRFAPLVNGIELGPGHRLYILAQQNDVDTHLYTYTSDVQDPLGSGGSTQLSDLGNGYYEVLLDIPGGRDEFELLLFIDSVSSPSFSIQVEL